MSQAKHACRLCGQTGHRQETRPSIAGQIIRDLTAKLGQRAGKAGKERRLRRVRKDGKLKAQATQPTVAVRIRGHGMWPDVAHGTTLRYLLPYVDSTQLGSRCKGRRIPKPMNLKP